MRIRHGFQQSMQHYLEQTVYMLPMEPNSVRGEKDLDDLTQNLYLTTWRLDNLANVVHWPGYVGGDLGRHGVGGDMWVERLRVRGSFCDALERVADTATERIDGTVKPAGEMATLTRKSQGCVYSTSTRTPVYPFYYVWRCCDVGCDTMVGHRIGTDMAPVGGSSDHAIDLDSFSIPKSAAYCFNEKGPDDILGITGKGRENKYKVVLAGRKVGREGVAPSR